MATSDSSNVVSDVDHTAKLVYEDGKCLFFCFTNLPNPTFLLSNLPLLWHQFLQISCRSLLPVNNAVHRAEGVVASCIKIIIVFSACTLSLVHFQWVIDWIDFLKVMECNRSHRCPAWVSALLHYCLLIILTGIHYLVISPQLIWDSGWRLRWIG